MKIGDKVKVVRCIGDSSCEYIGETFTIRRKHPDHTNCWQLEGIDRGHYWEESELKLIKGNGMTKFYRVLKETPMWVEGAIISNESDSGEYRPIDAVFTKDIKGLTESWYEGAAVVENQEDWFEQVFELKGLKKMAFGSKKQAQAAAAALYEGGK